MDLITHFVVPYAILTLVKSKHKLEGALGGISLDFDTLIAWVGILFPEFFIVSHRGITHSFIFGFLTSVLFLYILSRKQVNGFISRVIKRDLHVEFTKTTVLIVYFGALTHLFLDFLTTKGIPLLYPFSLTRFSAELYNSVDLTTMCLALAVLLVLYIKTNPRYRKVALYSFLIVLVAIGGIRAYEKMDVFSEVQTFEDCSNITAYPTSNIFQWSVVENNPEKTRYIVFSYNNLKKSVLNFRIVDPITVKNGPYKSGLDAIKSANSLPEVQRFKWNSYYTFEDAEYSSTWKVTYFDVVNSYNNQSITVSVQ
jgi:inner membrane protein